MNKESIVIVNARRIIKDRGLKHKAVAHRAGYSNSQFSDLMCGRRTIKDADILAIANALEVTPNDLFASAPASGE